MLSLHKSLPLARTPQEKERLARQIESTDRAIDALVYQLYGLTEEEIRIVEGVSRLDRTGLRTGLAGARRFIPGGLWPAQVTLRPVRS
jgi:hypothetical protein